MTLSTFAINLIHLFEREIRIIGVRIDIPNAPEREVVVRKGKKGSDLQMKGPDKKWEFQILLPPATFDRFAILISQKPKRCEFDVEAASEFCINWQHETRPLTVATTFSIRK